MRIEFSGANRTVTGSCHLIDVSGKRILLDCGMYQGKRELARQLNETLPAGPIDAVVLSHGHLDHCGKLPVLVKRGYDGPIYATPATVDVARVVLLDSAEIQEENADYLNRRSRETAADEVHPLYRRSDAHDVLKLFRRVPYEQRVDLGNGVSFAFFDAGHILGSAYVVMEWTESGAKKSLLFTADIGRPNTPIFRDPTPLKQPFDTIITESTYGGRKHAAVDDIEPQFAAAVQQIVESRGRLILPSFAVGRTQTMLWHYMKQVQDGKLPKINLYVDSPMGVEISQVTREHTDLWDDESIAMLNFPKVKEAMNLVKFASTGEQSRQINNDRGPCIIVASSPTCEFGRVLHHLKLSVERPTDMIVFTGWIPPHTLGRRLQDGEQRVKILDRFYEVKCQIRTLHGLSAHADGDELLAFLKPGISPKTVMHIVHGEADQAEALGRRLLEHGVAVANVPAMHSTAMTGVVSTGPAARDSGDVE